MFNLPMDDFDLFNVEPLDQIEVGYRFTLEMLKEPHPMLCF
jgi:hypothetical protein